MLEMRIVTMKNTSTDDIQKAAPTVLHTQACHPRGITVVRLPNTYCLVPQTSTKCADLRAASGYTTSEQVDYPPPRMPFLGGGAVPEHSGFTGATPVTGNPFPGPPLNMANIGTPLPPGSMGMPYTMMPPQSISIEDPVIPPPPSAFQRRAGTPYHRAMSPWSSESSDDDDDITPERRERMQPPLAPGQYGPYDRDRRREPRPALRRGNHRRAESSPAFRADRSPIYPPPPGSHGPEVIPPPGVLNATYDAGYGAPPFPQPQVHPIYSQPEPVRQEPPPETFRPRPFSPIRRRHNPLPPPPKNLFTESPYARILEDLRKPINDEEIKARLASQAAVHTVGAIPVPLAQTGPHLHHHHHGTRSSREKKKKGKGLFRSLSARLQSRRSDDEEDLSPAGGITQAFVGGQSTTIYPMVQTMPDGSTALIYNPPVAQVVQPVGTVPVVPVQMAQQVVPPVPPVIPGYVPGAAPAVSPGVVSATSQQYQPGPPPTTARAPSTRSMYQKFMQHPRLRTLLLETGDRDLVLADQDPFWGEGPPGGASTTSGVPSCASATGCAQRASIRDAFVPADELSSGRHLPPAIRPAVSSSL
ncbi:hypothetical protein BN946_scf184747.g28 [Trametes cinnabarina]|uniref:Uncharacterized protein n=1 Tax=Pycnoporus cinnabarinus TaxID=5643 RepID=A0A060SS61_PYCCI|nr:hypothetical protein BN946_scf184747.g28 [Trametes cinnabarina]